MLFRYMCIEEEGQRRSCDLGTLQCYPSALPMGAILDSLRMGEQLAMKALATMGNW